MFTEVVLTLVSASTPALPRLPPMGWSSWNAFYCNVHETDVRTNAALLTSLGLRSKGYSQINIDDCWNNETRGADGKLRPALSFPSGMKVLASDMHAQNFTFGLYTSQTSKTCAGRAAAYGHEAVDAETYCKWGVDYLKIDLCGGDHYPLLNTSWIKFKEGFSQCDHPIITSVEYCGIDYPSGDSKVVAATGVDPVRGCGEWIAGLANLWRTSSDLQPLWSSVISTAAANNVMASVQKIGHYNDPDMLQVGNFLFQQNMNTLEMRTHFALWAIMAAPLILGKNLNDFPSKTTSKGMTVDTFLSIVGNEEIIAVDQDRLVIQGTNRTRVMYEEVWAKPLFYDNAFAVLLMNTEGKTTVTTTMMMAQKKKNRTVTLDFAQIGLSSTTEAKVRDLWEQRELGVFTGSFARSLAQHDNAMLKVTPL